MLRRAAPDDGPVEAFANAINRFSVLNPGGKESAALGAGIFKASGFIDPMT
jgi:hypothetical protein